jgi:5-dehydro-2-deoxygluconokinase
MFSLFGPDAAAGIVPRIGEPSERMGSMPDSEFDVITVGRVSMDLFSRDIGAPFAEIGSFETSVGGSPTNIAIGCRRLGLRAAVLTAVGDDEVGKFVLHYLQNEGVETRFIPLKPHTRTGLAILGVMPPDRFPLVFYRDNAADIHISIDDAAPVLAARARVFSLSGTALSRGTCRDVTLLLAERMRRDGVTVFMDLDLRPDQWNHPLAFGVNVRSLLPSIHILIGTEEEFCAALGSDPRNVMAKEPVTGSQREEIEQRIRERLGDASGPGAWVVKRGPRGVSVYTRTHGDVHADGYRVEVVNTVGAGDAFAAGLIYGYLKGWDWYRCARAANACGAITVTRHGCAKALPYEKEVLEFMAARGGA